MQRFRNLGLIETNLDRFLVINEKKLADYIALRAAGHVSPRRSDSFQLVQLLDKGSLPN